MAEEHLPQIDRAISALQDPTRRRILLDFYAHRPEWTVDDVASAVGVHRTVAHSHLERLVALGFLASGQRRGKFGKPAKLYTLAHDQIELSYPIRRFARLASLLAASLKQFAQRGAEEARRAGRSYGSSLVRRPADSVQTALSQLSPLGADYVLVEDNVVRARNCIFRQACEGSEEVVCELHAGLLEGALDRAGLKFRTEAFGDYERFGCSYRLREAPT